MKKFLIVNFLLISLFLYTLKAYCLDLITVPLYVFYPTINCSNNDWKCLVLETQEWGDKHYKDKVQIDINNINTELADLYTKAFSEYSDIDDDWDRFVFYNYMMQKSYYNKVIGSPEKIMIKNNEVEILAPTWLIYSHESCKNFNSIKDENKQWKYANCMNKSIANNRESLTFKQYKLPVDTVIYLQTCLNILPQVENGSSIKECVLSCFRNKY